MQRIYITIILSWWGIVFAADKEDLDVQRILVPTLRSILVATDIPLDNIQTNKQVYSKITSYMQVIKNIYCERGFKSFFQGTFPRLGINFIRSGYQFTFFKDIPLYIQNSEKFSYFPKNLAVSFSIAAADTVFINGLEFWKVRRMTNLSFQKHVSSPIKTLEYLTRGGLSTFSGNLISWSIFLELEERLRKHLKSRAGDEKLHFKDYLLVGSITGVIDSLATTPFYNIKNQQQAWGAGAKTFREAIKLIGNQKGIKGFYAGFFLDYFRTLVFCSFDVWARDLAEHKGSLGGIQPQTPQSSEPL